MMMMMMEWENQQQQQNESVMNGVNMYVKVMNDEQLETLRKQIAVYASICEHLVEMHKNLTAHQDLAATGQLPFLLSLLFVGSLFKCWVQFHFM